LFVFTAETHEKKEERRKRFENTFLKTLVSKKQKQKQQQQQQQQQKRAKSYRCMRDSREYSVAKTCFKNIFLVNTC